ncbi:hypothetical protein ABIA70_004352, partial [Arthrobacter sp. 754]
GGKSVVTTCVPAGEGRCGVVILLLVPAIKPGFVGWEPHSGRKQSCYLFTLSRV